MYTIEISERALKQAMNAYHYYELRLIGLGERFLEELENSFARLRDNPAAYSFLKSGIRSCLVNKFPYRVIFEVHESKVAVYAIFHTARLLPSSYR